jgi:hypothetical protein
MVAKSICFAPDEVGIYIRKKRPCGPISGDNFEGSDFTSSQFLRQLMPWALKMNEAPVSPPWAI